MSNGCGCLATIGAFLVLWFILSLISAGLIFFLWNWVIVWLFYAPVITFWRAWAIGVILGLLGSIFGKR